MEKHTCRYGVEVRDEPTQSYGELLDQETEKREDDGMLILAGGPQSTCADCGVGTLRWAEGGYAPWHRICDRCGSHWDLHPIQYINWDDGKGWTGTDRRGCVAPVSELDPDDRLPEIATHQALLALALEAGTEPNGSKERQRIASASWAVRARFY